MNSSHNAGSEELVSLFAQFGYVPTRQTDSHIRLTASVRGVEKHVTIPRHTPLKRGTLLRGQSYCLAPLKE
ncbi:MAG: type II toxin-antitoxin system HicA family toxin [Nitrospirae bacterium]|nr:MAG: type II toxin-antitoxin system HicA family toxin [Nitrospirota bacterium]